MIVDDVISSGLSISESVGIIRESGAEPRAALVALDRQERGEKSDKSAIDEARARHDLDIKAIVTLADVLDYLKRHPSLNSYTQSIRTYLEKYGTNT